MGSAVSTYRWFSGEHNVDNDANTPDITFFSIVAVQNFRSNVVWCSIHLAHDVAFFSIMVSTTKINDFQRVVRLVNDYVFRLQITMNDILSMTISNGFQDLSGDLRGALFIKFCIS